MDGIDEKPVGNGEAKWLLLLLMLLASWVLLILLADPIPPRATIVLYLLPGLLLIALVLCVRLAFRGNASPPLPWVTAGFVFIAGGAIGERVTRWQMEQTALNAGATNRIAAALIESGRSETFAFGFGTAVQAFIALLAFSAWVAFLRHRHILAASVDRSTWANFVRSATGGSHLSWRAWFFPMRTSELPHAYHLFWVLMAPLAASFAERWYAALENLGVMTTGRWLVLGLAILLGWFGYGVWLWAAEPAKAARK